MQVVELRQFPSRVTGRQPIDLSGTIAFYLKDRERPATVAADIDSRAGRAWTEQKFLAVRCHQIVGKALSDERQRVIGDSPPLGSIYACSPKLGFHPAGGSADQQSISGELLNGGEPLGGQQGWPIWNDEYASTQPDFPGTPCHIGEGGERVQV